MSRGWCKMTSRQSPALRDRLALSILKARRFFFKMTMREKILVLVFAFALVLMWFSWQLDRNSVLSAKHTAASRAERSQQNWLDIEDSLRATFEVQKSQIDIDSLPGKDEVSARLDSIGRPILSAPPIIGDARTEEGVGMLFHTYQVNVAKDTFANIYNFTKAVKEELPYLSLEKVLIQAQERDDRLLTVRYDFKSIEYTK